MAEAHPNHDAARRAATDIVRTLADAGHTAYFAGGCVRDELLGRTPSDYDIATDATPDRVRSLFKKTAAVGASFGVILVKLHGEVVEVATFRADGGYSDARRPDSIRFSTPEEDARRRDFTVNALFLDPLHPAAAGALTAEGGAIIDFVGGLADLASRTLRAVGIPDHALAEDHLRALRAVRLTGKLGFTLDPATADAIRRHARDLRGISRERIGDEVRAIMALPGRAASISLLHSLDLAASVLDAATPAAEPPTEPPTEHPAALPTLSGLPAEAPLHACLAAWCLDLAPTLKEEEVGGPGGGGMGVVGAWRKALCLSNAEEESLAGTLHAWFTLRDRWSTLGVAARKRLAVRGGFDPAVTLLAARDPQGAGVVRGQVDHLKEDGVGLNPSPLVTGDDLVVLGARPGPAFRSVLDRVYDAQLEGRVREKAAALELARSMIV